MDATQKILSDITVFNKYAKYIPELHRRETWEELCQRNMDMHIAKFPTLRSEIGKVYHNFVIPKKVLPSMRSLQFGGRPIELSNIRLFNCAYLPIDSLEAFSETMFLLLSGTGVGYSVQNRHISKLPTVVGPNKNKTRRYLISDDIAGWADAVKMLFKAYFHGRSEPLFDYRDIRQKGARLITSGGKAPGPEPLKVCLERLTEVLDGAVGRQLHSIEAHDALCHIADAVLSGGIRRAAMIALFSPEDESMLTCKGQLKMDDWEFEKTDDKGFVSYRGFCIYQGKRHDTVLSEYDYKTLTETSRLPWYFFAQQRGRANNSAVLHREFTSKQDFMQIWKKVEESQAGEPGVYWTNDYDWGVNPCVEIGLRPFQCCVSADTKLITRAGISTIKDAVGKKIEIWNGERWSEVEPFQTGKADQLYRVEFSDGSYLDATNNHKFLAKNRFDKEYREMTTLELERAINTEKYVLSTPRYEIEYDKGIEVYNAYDYGFVLGDGCGKTQRNGNFLPIYADVYAGKKQNINFKDAEFISEFPAKIDRPKIGYRRYRFNMDRDFANKLKYNGGLPSEIFSWSKKSILDFIAGWADADGAQASKGIRIYGREDLIRSAQLLLSKAGVASSVNLMSKKGTITNLATRNEDVWYLQITTTFQIPCQRLICNNADHNLYKGKGQCILSITLLEGLHESYCLNEQEKHQCVFNNVLTKQCNLTEVNVSDIESQEDLNARVKAAAFLGTLQASYTDFYYLRSIWKETAEKDALLGVGMTGIGSGRTANLDLTEAAEIVKEENARVAALIGINEAARTTCVKPSGTTSCVVGSSSGIHAWHNDFYIRRMRVGKNEALYGYMKSAVPDLVEDCKFKPAIEAVMSFPQKAPEGAIYRTENYKDLLERVKRFNKRWVFPGHRDGKNSHNVSCTVSLKDDEWEGCGEWMWKNRNFYAGISVLPFAGGTYVQAPFEDITEDIFNEMLQHLKDIDLTQVLEVEDITDHKAEAACAGGACEV